MVRAPSRPAAAQLGCRSGWSAKSGSTCGRPVGLCQEVSERLATGGLELAEGPRPPLLRRAHERRQPDPGQQVLADLRAQEAEVVVAGHLVADHADAYSVLLRVVPVLAVDGDAAPGGLGNQEGHVELGEHAGGERVRAGGLVDHDILALAVEQVVEQQLDRADLGVVAGQAEV